MMKNILLNLSDAAAAAWLGHVMWDWPVGDGGFVAISQARNVSMQVGQPTSHGLGNMAQLAPRHHVGLQEVRQRTLCNKKVHAD